MTTEATPAAPAAPAAATPAPAAPQAAAPPPPAPAVPAPAAQSPLAAPPPPPAEPGEGNEPDWFKRRLEQHERSITKKLLGGLGVEKLEDAKAAVVKARELEEAQKSEIEKANAKAEALKPKAARAELLEEIVVGRVTRELAALTPEQKAAVLTGAGEDPAAQLRLIDALKPTWVAPPPPAAAAPVAPAQAAPPAPPAPPPAPPPLAPPATTAPPNAAPPAAPAPIENHLAVWERLKELNPLRAEAYRNQFRFEIEAAKKARAA